MRLNSRLIFPNPNFFCLPNSSAGTKRNIGTSMNIPIMSHLGSYLGIPILQGCVSKDTFASILGKMRKKLSNWKANSLSMAGRRVLVQSALATVPTYIMQPLALLVSTCNNIDRICRNFLWGHSDDTRKIHTINWNDVCQPQELGGLGLRQAKDFNLAFLMKASHIVSRETLGSSSS